MCSSLSFELIGSAQCEANDNKVMMYREGSFYLYFHDVTALVGGSYTQTLSMSAHRGSMMCDGGKAC